MDAGEGKDGGAGSSCRENGNRCDEPPGQCFEEVGTCTDEGCVYAPKEEGTVCSEGSAPGQCHAAAGTCVAGICTYPPKESGATCDDGDLGTTGDACDGTGKCEGAAVACQVPPGQCYES
ncbi:MAG TPA: hypothetical protein VLQ93_07120, partial [Myxococcaceae bacterium]|nr:hypothetical protein [Myxococcaceae bacterium]